MASTPAPTRESATAPVATSEWRGGWSTVIAAALASGFGPGLFQNLSSLFTPGLEASFGWSRGEIATAAGIALAGALVAPFVGRFADRFGVRPVIVGSAAMLAAGYLTLAMVGGAFWQYQLAILLLVLAVPGTSSLVYGKLIAARFVHQRGLALAVATSGLAFTTMLVPPVLGLVIGGYGWRAGALALGATGIAVLPLVLLALRGAPTGPTRPTPESAAANLPAEGFTAAEARRDSRFWCIVGGAVLVNMATTGLVTQIVPLGIELRLSALNAAVLLTAFGASAIVGRVVVGYLVDHMKPQPVAAAVALVSALAFLGLAAEPQGFAAILLLVFFAGLMNGAENDLLPFLAARLFGLRAFGEIYGSAMPLGLLGTGIGIVGFGRLHDTFGNYRVALLVGSAALMLAGVCFLLLRDRPLPLPRAQAASEACDD